MQDVLNFSSTELRPHLECYPPRKPTRNCPRGLSQALSACTYQSSDSQKESRFQHNAQCWSICGTVSPSYHLGNGGIPHKFPDSNLASSKDSILGPITSPLFCIVMNSIMKILSLMHLSCLNEDVH